MKNWRVIWSYRPGLNWLGSGKGKTNDYIRDPEGKQLRMHWSDPQPWLDAIRIALRLQACSMFEVEIVSTGWITEASRNVMILEDWGA